MPINHSTSFPDVMAISLEEENTENESTASSPLLGLSSFCLEEPFNDNYLRDKLTLAENNDGNSPNNITKSFRTSSNAGIKIAHLDSNLTTGLQKRASDVVYQPENCQDIKPEYFIKPPEYFEDTAAEAVIKEAVSPTIIPREKSTTLSPSLSQEEEDFLRQILQTSPNLNEDASKAAATPYVPYLSGEFTPPNSLPRDACSSMYVAGTKYGQYFSRNRDRCNGQHSNVSANSPSRRSTPNCMNGNQHRSHLSTDCNGNWEMLSECWEGVPHSYVAPAVSRQLNFISAIDTAGTNSNQQWPANPAVGNGVAARSVPKAVSTEHSPANLEFRGHPSNSMTRANPIHSPTSFAAVGSITSPAATVVRSGIGSITPPAAIVVSSGNGNHINRIQEEKMRREDREAPDRCAFCHKNGDPSDHVLKDADGKAVCKVLRSFTCPLCGATGDYAHTRKYCKQNAITKGDPAANGFAPGPLNSSVNFFHILAQHLNGQNQSKNLAYMISQRPLLINEMIDFISRLYCNLN